MSVKADCSLKEIYF